MGVAICCTLVTETICGVSAARRALGRVRISSTRLRGLLLASNAQGWELVHDLKPSRVAPGLLTGDRGLLEIHEDLPHALRGVGLPVGGALGRDGPGGLPCPDPLPGWLG